MSGFWKNKRILITGYEGFLGSHLTKALLESKARVFGLDILTYRKNTILADDFKKIKIIKGDVRDYRLVSEIIKKNRIEFVFHLAAASLVGEALAYPRKAFSTNIEGTWNVLEASRHSGAIKAIVIASSDKAYGAQKELPYRESSPLCGSHPYDVSKSCADLLSYTYFHTYGLPVCVTRCGNIFGPGDFNFSRIIPDAIRCALTGKTLLIRSDGRFIRDYIYVKDIVSGYLLLAQKMQSAKICGEAFNFSYQFPLSVLRLVRLISKLTGKKVKFKITNRARYEIRRQYLSSGKAKKVLGWRPTCKLEKALEETIQWHRKRFKRKY